MSRPRIGAWLGGLACLLSLAPGGVRAQGWNETQAWGAAVASRPAFAGAGVGYGTRDAGRTRLAAAGALGVMETGKLAGRLELTWHFLLDPERHAGPGVYGGGGLALASDAAGDLRPWIQLVLGVETAPGTRRSVFLETGVGGGIRVAAGLRWRSRRQP